MNKLKLSAVLVTASILISFTSAYSAENKQYAGQISRNITQIEDLINHNKYNEAQNLCNEILKQNPNNTEARVQLGSIYSAQFKLDAAIREFSKILEKNSNNAAAHNGIGLAYYRKTTSSNMDIRENIDKYYEAAIQEFEAAIQVNPDYYKAYNNIGKLLQEMGKIDEAERYYRKALEIEPKYSEAIENLGTTYFAKNQVDAAAEKYKEAIELNSKNSSAYYHLGEALLAKGQFGKAINYLQTSLYLFPNSAPVHDMLGKAYEMQSNEAAAITEYKKAMLIKPEYTQPYLRLSNIYQGRGDDEFAISDLRNAVSINPNFLEGKLKIADLSLNLGKIDQAIKYYKEVMNDSNYSGTALKGLAKAYFMQAQAVNLQANIVSEYEYVEAENAIKQAIEYNPDDLQLYLALLRISRLTNDDSKSQYYMSKILTNPKNNSVTHIIKGEAYLTDHKYADANNEFMISINISNKIEDWLNLGEIFIINRQYGAAKEAFNRVLIQDQNNLKAIRSLERIQNNENQGLAKLNIAKGFFNEGQKAASIEALRDCLSLDPNLPEAQLLLAESFEKEKYYFNAIEHYSAYVNLASIEYKDVIKYRKKIEKLENKVKKLQAKGQYIKKFTRM
ncbi:MAG: tetratricopeptide repeat protein [Candidatus Gastranaerophilales bacterium]|nr:tetratricopeptide repeat protein [Candidatus Gastranaerophilales bacterium]